MIDLLAKRHGIKITRSQDRALTGEVQIEGRGVAFAKPVTYMNISGQSVRPLMRRHNIDIENLLVIADDMDMPSGAAKIKPKGSAGGHKGHKSIISSLGTQDYARLKIGVRDGEGKALEHVLDRPNPESRAKISEAIEAAADAVEAWLADGLDAAMNQLNSR